MTAKEFDLFIKNGVVITMNRALEVYYPGALVVQGDALFAVGPLEDLKGLEEKARRVIDAQGRAVLPGLINSHTHAAMTLFRGLADDLPLADWLENHIFPAERKLDGRWVYWGTLLACAEMILSGTTTFCDMYLFENEVARAAQKAGMRALVGEVLYDFPSPNYGPIEKGFEYSEEMIQTYRNDPLISVAVEPHSPLTCSPDLLNKSNKLCEKYQVPLIIHVSETRREVEEIHRRYQASPVAHLKKLGLLVPHLIAVHCVALSPADMDDLQEGRVKIAHCPESNMKLASGMAPVIDLLKRGVTVGLGTDGCASNNNLDLFQEMDVAAKLYKLYHSDPAIMEASATLRLATIEGARVLQMEDKIGSLEAGKKADFLILDLNKPHLTPLYDIYSHIVYSAKSSDVTHVFINGKPVLEGRKLLTLDLEEIYFQVRQFAEAVEKERGLKVWNPIYKKL
jgi:5-methylthioadenosine/S-adenosylhomocysteine deaminase